MIEWCDYRGKEFRMIYYEKVWILQAYAEFYPDPALI